MRSNQYFFIWTSSQNWHVIYRIFYVVNIIKFSFLRETLHEWRKWTEIFFNLLFWLDPNWLKLKPIKIKNFGKFDFSLILKIIPWVEFFIPLGKYFKLYWDTVQKLNYFWCHFDKYFPWKLINFIGEIRFSGTQSSDGIG